MGLIFHLLIHGHKDDEELMGAEPAMTLAGANDTKSEKDQPG